MTSKGANVLLDQDRRLEILLYQLNIKLVIHCPRRPPTNNQNNLLVGISRVVFIGALPFEAFLAPVPPTFSASFKKAKKIPTSFHLPLAFRRHTKRQTFKSTSSTPFSLSGRLPAFSYCHYILAGSLGGSAYCRHYPDPILLQSHHPVKGLDAAPRFSIPKVPLAQQCYINSMKAYSPSTIRLLPYSEFSGAYLINPGTLRFCRNTTDCQHQHP